jgi:osmotically-inducible protein OsmY
VNTPFKHRAMIICTCLGVVVWGSAAAATAYVYSIPDADLRDSVQYALHADPYFYDGHIEVSVDHGVVYLRGLVFSDWDLRDAIRIASKAAGDRRVINNLTIVEGGRR